jgi:peptide chain release factor subunit 1
MFSEQDLNELVEFRSENAPVLSLYLNVDPTQQKTDQYKLVLRSLLKGVAEEAHDKDIDAVERYFDFEFDWQGKGVAIFSCWEADFWRTYSLAVPVQNNACVAHRPYIKPLTDVLNAYGRYGVVLVDQEGARMFLFHLGELAEATGMLGEEVRRAKHGGASGLAGRRGGMTVRAARREEAVVYRNLKEMVEATEKFSTHNGVRRLVLGGTEANVSQFLDMLPKPLQGKVIGTFTIDSSAPVLEVQARTMDLIEEVAQQRERELVEDMMAGWKRGSGATVGLSDTLAALQEGRVATLLILAGYEAPGYRCDQCRYLTLADKDECPLCGGSMQEVEELVDIMTHRALEQGVDVEVVRNSPDLEENGSIGALLRY